MGKRNSSSTTAQLTHTFIGSGLLEAFDWFDQGLQNLLVAHGLPTLNKTQSMFMLYLSAGVYRPADMARRMRISRQAIRHVSAQLVEMGLIDVVDDEQVKRGRRLVFRDDKQAMRDVAESIVRDMEGQLRERIGAENMDSLRKILQLDWGEVVGAQADAKQSPGTAAPPQHAAP